MKRIFFFLTLQLIFLISISIKPVLLLAAGRGNFPVSSMPVPTLFPLPNPVQSGQVVLTATIRSCMVHPYAGEFSVCKKNSFPSGPPFCKTLLTDRNGWGSISLPVGSYTVFPPPSCPSGKICALGLPVTWNIKPSSFILNPGNIIDITASGTNNFLMCPVRF